MGQFIFILILILIIACLIFKGPILWFIIGVIATIIAVIGGFVLFLMLMFKNG